MAVKRRRPQQTRVSEKSGKQSVPLCVRNAPRDYRLLHHRDCKVIYSFGDTEMSSVKQQIMSLIQRNLWAEAKTLCVNYCQTNQNNVEAWLLLGAIHGQLGTFSDAETCCRRAIAIAPAIPEAHYNLGVSLLKQGKTNAAAASFVRALELKPNFAEAHHDLGNALQSQGLLDPAAESYSKALAIKPSFTEALNNLGRIFQRQGKLNAAIECYRRALHSQPGNAIVHFNLGSALWEQGSLEPAAQSYREAIRFNPYFAEAHHHLGSVLMALQKDNEAILSYEAAIRIKPDYADAHYALGSTFYRQRRIDEAVIAYKAVLNLRPDFVEPYKILARIYYEQGEFELTTECYQKIVNLTGSDGAKIRLATVLPMIIHSVQQVDELRDRLDERITSLLDSNLHVNDPINEIGYANFLLAYHGRNDRMLQSKLAQLYISACPSLSYTAVHCQQAAPRNRRGTIKIGFISRYLKNHSIGKTSKGVIAHLSRDKFTVFVFFLDPPQDETGLFIQQHADKAILLPDSLEAARKCIEEQKLDILFYQDIGMDFFTFFLAFSRLAPIQCTSFGHPVTTGIPNMDYYISTDCWEPDDGEKHYTEKLIRLKNVASVAYYSKPAIPASLKPRSYFGLNDHDHIYICPQTLFKLHPEFDRLLADILHADPQGLVVLIDGIHGHWSELLRMRFRETLSDVQDRIRFLPQQTGTDFINLIAVSDVMLDTIHFCGFNTTLEAFAVGVPVVTMPGRFMRGRHTMSFYKKMGFTDCVARTEEEYVQIAVRLGTDSTYRENVKQKILATNDVIWEDMEVIREFERCFEQILQDGLGDL